MTVALFTIIALLAAAAQARLPTLWWLGGLRLELLAGLVGYGALSFPRGAALWLALVAGLAQDALSATPFGLSALAYGLATVFLTSWRQTLDRELPWIQIGAGALASAAAGLTSCLARHEWAGQAPKIFLVALLSGLLAPFVFAIADHLRQRQRS